MEFLDFGNVQHLQNTVTTQEISSVAGYTPSLIVIVLVSLLNMSTGVFWAPAEHGQEVLVVCLCVRTYIKNCVFYIYIFF
jgi:hypothetical protein